MNNYLKLKKNNFVSLFIVFLSSRLITCLLILRFLPIYNQKFTIFSKDLSYYIKASSGLYTPNFLFSYLVRFFGLDTTDPNTSIYIIGAFLLSIITLLPWIFLANRVLEIKSSYFYSILIGFHPYLAIYSLKLDTMIFSIIPVSLLVIQKILNFEKLKYPALIITTVSSFFRSQLLLLAWIQIGTLIRDIKLGKFNNKFVIIFISTILFICSLIQFNYGADILTQNFGCYSITQIKEFFIEKNFPDSISSIFSFLLTPIIHIFLLLGSREAIAIYCLNLPREIASSGQLNIIFTLSFLLFHLLALSKMIKWIICNRKSYGFDLFLPFALILPNLYGIAHMRYFICFIPYIMIFLFKPVIRNVKN